MPVASRLTVMSLHTATGGVVSVIVTIAAQDEEFPHGSVTVTVTSIGAAVLEQSNSVTLAV